MLKDISVISYTQTYLHSYSCTYLQFVKAENNLKSNIVKKFYPKIYVGMSKEHFIYHLDQYFGQLNRANYTD